MYAGECFGLLGVNGAGKTTTFSMLTGDTSISSGDAFLGGKSVARSPAGARKHQVGYCPQFDALIDQMTVRETLWMYARLRGIHRPDIGRMVEKMIDQLTLRKCADRQAGKLRYRTLGDVWSLVCLKWRLLLTERRMPTLVMKIFHIFKQFSTLRRIS